jgi:hypothetical protein
VYDSHKQRHTSDYRRFADDHSDDCVSWTQFKAVHLQETQATAKEVLRAVINAFMFCSSFSSDRTVQLERSLSYTPPKSIGWIFALIAGIATLILAAVAVIVKWTLLKPIHAEIISKFKRDEPVFFQRHGACRSIDLREEFNIVTFPAACLLIVLFSLSEGQGLQGLRWHCHSARLLLPRQTDFRRGGVHHFR